MSTDEQTPKVVFAHGSAGSFMDPPGHPSHRYEVRVYDNGRVKRDADAYLSVASAAEAEWLPESARERARKLLDDATIVESEMWVRHVYGYFRSMYVAEDGSRNASDLIADRSGALPAERHAAVAMIRQYFPEHEPRTDLIADSSYCYGSYPCVKCGQRVQYEAKVDALAVFDRSNGEQCSEGGAHEWPPRDTVTVHISNGYACGRQSERTVAVPAPGGLSSPWTEAWWEEIVQPETGDGHPCGASEHSHYSATVVAADTRPDLIGATHEW
jgi:hypothetical protein